MRLDERVSAVVIVLVAAGFLGNLAQALVAVARAVF